IAFLASFLILGLLARDFPLWHAPLVFAACLATQIACERILRRKPAGLLSPLITSLGLTLLLRAGAWWVPVLAGVLAIGSKFTLRVRGRHFFNPANFGLWCLMLITPRAPAARLLFAAIVASVAFALQLRFLQNPIVWALFYCAPLVPVLDALTSNEKKVTLPCALQSVVSSSP